MHKYESLLLYNTTQNKIKRVPKILFQANSKVNLTINVQTFEIKSQAIASKS